MHDEEVHPDPDTFDPDRFTGVNGRRIEDDPRDLVFGFGRRYVTSRLRLLTGAVSLTNSCIRTF